MNKTNTKITVGIVVYKGDKILFGRAHNKEGKRKYILPVGHLEFMESFTDCAKRELSEECGIEIENIKFHFISNTDKYSPKHYVHIGLIADWKSGEPEVLEPGGIEAWEWRNPNDIPKKLSIGAEFTLKALEDNSPMYDIYN
jgi:8-oxo-dGTP diphosphatase